MQRKESEFQREKAEIQKEFDDIIQEALNGNVKALQNRTVVDVQVESETPVYKLAKAGRHDAVTVLVEHARANINFALLGYMEGGYFTQAEALIEAGADLSVALNGAIRYGIERIPDSPFKKSLQATINNATQFTTNTYYHLHSPDLKQLVIGYAHIGDDAAIDALLLSTTNDTLRASIAHTAYCAYIAVGNENNARALYAQQYFSPHHFTSINSTYLDSKGDFYFNIQRLINESRNGRANVTEELSKVMLSDECFTQELMLAMCCGFYQGGHVKQANHLFSELPILRKQLPPKMRRNIATESILSVIGIHDKLFNTMFDTTLRALMIECIFDAPNSTPSSQGKFIIDMMSIGIFSNIRTPNQNKILECLKPLQCIFDPLLSNKYSIFTSTLRILSNLDQPLLCLLAAHTVITKSMTGYTEDEKNNAANKLAEKATAMNQLMRSYDLSFNQLRIWQRSDVRGWILNGTQLVRTGRLHSDIFSYITSKLTGLSLHEATDLIQKICYFHVKNTLLKSIDKYTSTSGMFFGPAHGKRASSFKEACVKSTSKDEFGQLVGQQLRLFQPGATGNTASSAKKYEKSLINKDKDDFYNLLERAQYRLGSHY